MKEVLIMPVFAQYHINDLQLHTIVLIPTRKMRLLYVETILLHLWTSDPYNKKAVYWPMS
jgi:hypothetical protein